MSDLEKIYKKQEEMAQDISEIKVILGKQEVNIDYHIKRTNLLEESVTLLRGDLKPVEDHVKFMQGGLKLVGLIALGLSIVVSVFKIISYIQ